jgi:hypothetical protein
VDENVARAASDDVEYGSGGKRWKKRRRRTMKRVYTYSATVRAVQYNGALVLTVLLRVS